MSKFVIINGPNLNLVGIRQPEIYGSVGFDEFIPQLRNQFSDHEIIYHQSNHEGFLIDWLHQYGFSVDGIVLNAGGLTHTSVALADAVSSVNSPVIEIHISNIFEREVFRRQSFLSPVCCHSIVGKGLEGYARALNYFLNENNLIG